MTNSDQIIENGAFLQVPRLLTVKQCIEAKIYPSEGGLRSIIFHAHENGFDKVLRKIGRRCLIDVCSYYKWVEEINQPKRRD